MPSSPANSANASRAASAAFSSASKSSTPCSGADSKRRWAAYEDVHGDDSDFEQIRLDFMASRPSGVDGWREGPVAYSSSRLLAIRPLVDFAAAWMERHRTAGSSG